MAEISEIKVNVVANVELVNLQCKDVRCVHNLRKNGWLACNLKHVTIGDGGVCLSYQEKAE